MVVGGETRLGEPVGLSLRQHAERDARLHAELPHALHHHEHAVEIFAVLDLAPGGAHAESRGAGILGELRLGQHVVDVEQLFPLQPGLLRVMRRLRAIGTVLGAGARLDREQARQLNRAVLVMAAMDLAGLVDQLKQGHRQQSNNFVPGPIVARSGLGRTFVRFGSGLPVAVERIRGFEALSLDR